MSISYSLYIDEEGSKRLVEETKDGQPFQFISGFGVALDTFEQQLIPLEAGAKFDFSLTKDEAYGDYRDISIMNMFIQMLSSRCKMMKVIVSMDMLLGLVKRR